MFTCGFLLQAFICLYRTFSFPITTLKKRTGGFMLNPVLFTECIKLIWTVLGAVIRLEGLRIPWHANTDFIAFITDDDVVCDSSTTVELRWLELMGTVGASSTHPCVWAILSLTNLKFGSCVLYVITDTTFFSTKVAKRMWHLSLINNPLHARVKMISRMC